MSGIVPKTEAKGVDICGDDKDHYIIRSDIGCYMQSTDIHKGLNLNIYSLHPCCQGGDHYLASKTRFYIIKGNKCRSVSDLKTDSDAKVFDLHEAYQNGDYYLYAKGHFHIIFKSITKEDGTEHTNVIKKTSNLNTYEGKDESNLEDAYKDGLYYWGTKDHINTIKKKDEWGVHYTTCAFQKDAEPYKYSIHPDVLNFLPGGLTVTHGPAFGKWELIKKISNDCDISTKWTKSVSRKVGYTKSKSSNIEHNWNISLSTNFGLSSLIQNIIQFQFSLSAQYGGKSVKTESENWEEATEETENISLEISPKSKVHVWQYKLGLGKEDILFCREIKLTKNSNPPVHTPLPSNFNSGDEEYTECKGEPLCRCMRCNISDANAMEQSPPK